MRQFFGGSGSDRFRHGAVFYRGLDDLASATVPYIEEGLGRREPVLVAALPDRIRTLRSALGSDAERVEFLDMAEVGGNPARIIPVWREFVRDSVGAGSGRGIGEPVWSTRRDVEIEECRLHESLLNVAFDDGPPWQLLCPYDVDSLPAEVVEDAMRTHPLVDSAARSDVAYGGHGYANAGFAAPLPPVPLSAHELAFGAEDLGEVRDAVQGWSQAAGLSEEAAGHLVLAVHEVATNSVRHGGGAGLILAWTEPDSFVVEIDDSGYISDPLVGRELATEFADVAESGRGVWIVNQLCDLVQIRSLESGTQVRLHSWL